MIATRIRIIRRKINKNGSDKDNENNKLCYFVYCEEELYGIVLPFIQAPVLAK